MCVRFQEGIVTIVAFIIDAFARVSRPGIDCGLVIAAHHIAVFSGSFSILIAKILEKRSEFPYASAWAFAIACSSTGRMGGA